MEYDKELRQHLDKLLAGGQAHATFDRAVADMPKDARGQEIPGNPHSAWHLLEHLRMAQRDILDFSRNPNYKPMKWPDEYWPPTDAPPDDRAWDDSIRAFHADLKAMCDLVKNPSTDLYARIPWGEGQTILREALLVADHNAFHIGQLITLRRALGAWKE